MSKGKCEVCGREIPEDSVWRSHCDVMCVKAANITDREIDIHEIVRRVREVSDKEAFTLAAGVCEHKVGDAYGNPTCKPREQLEQARQWVKDAAFEGYSSAALDRLKKILETGGK